MRKKIALIVTLAAFIDATCSLSAGAAKGNLIKQASVTRSEAEHIALSQVQDGRVLSVELEKEHGRLVWSLDLARPKTKNITELQVDAKSGKIISTKIESPQDEKREAAGKN
jgi:uncharacterized membrane protein YkoI